MIVKDEAHVIGQSLDSVARFVDYWVIVDTGSQDGTPDAIREHMRRLGIPGELHQRPWRNFGHNRSEALTLAQGHCDYILVMDADDIAVGTPDFAGTEADGYLVCLDAGREGMLSHWRKQIFRNGAPWRYTGVIHEFADCDGPHTVERLRGGFGIWTGQHGARSLQSGNKFERDRDVLLAEVESHPDDARSTYYLARTYEWLGDFANARAWYERRSQMGGWDQEVACAMYKLAEMMDKTGEPWAAVQDAYLKAFAYRPVRPEALSAIALHYRRAGEYDLGYLFAAHAAQIELPDTEVATVVDNSRWIALDEQAVCASWTGRQAEGLTIWRRLLSRDDIPESDRDRIRANRDHVAAQLIASCGEYPAEIARRPRGRRDHEVTVSLVAGADAGLTEATLNSFLNCCTDSDRAGRFLLVDTGLAPADRADLADRYPFLEMLDAAGDDLAPLRAEVGGRYWLHLWQGWRFFTEEPLISRMIAVFEDRPEVYQVGINLGDAAQPGPECPARTGVMTAPGGSRYVLSGTAALGPAMFDVTRLDRVLAGEAGPTVPDATATLDDVLCVRT